MSSALFGSSHQQTRTKCLVEFKAGRMILEGKTLKPDTRKGLVYVYQSDDSLMHFCWKDRTSGIVEDDLILFPDDIETKRLNECTTGRVFLMRFKNSNKKFFFWMQELESDKDDKYWKKLNDLFNSPPVQGSSSGPGGSGSGDLSNAANERNLGGSSSANAASLLNSLGAEFGGSDLHSMLGSMNEQQLQMFLSGLMPLNSPSSNRSGTGSSSTVSSNQPSRSQSATTTTATTPAVASSTRTTTTAKDSNQESKEKSEDTRTVETTKPETSSASDSSKKIQMSDLQKILGNLAPSDSAATNRFQELDLSEVINLEVMAPILANKEIQERLMKHLPESEILPRTEQEMKAALTGFQFKKAMHSFSTALQRGQLGTLLKQFNLPEKVVLAAAQGNLVEFAKAMEEHSKNQCSSSRTENETVEDDNKMDTK